jgi:N-acetylmuramoyl-L-alanine amidase
MINVILHHMFFSWNGSRMRARKNPVSVGLVLLALVATAFAAPTAHAQQSDLEVRDVELNPQENQLESFTIQLSEPAKLRYVILHNPPRLAIDLPTFQWRVPPESMQHYRGTLLSQVRYARNSETTSRIVLDLKQNVKVKLLSTNPSDSPSFLLHGTGPTSTSQRGSRSSPSINVMENQQAAPSHPTSQHTDTWSPSQQRMASQPNTNTSARVKAAQSEETETNAPENAISVATPSQKGAKKIIAIDAGHGGQDPGCIGPSGAREKNVTLAYAKTLRDTLNATGRYRAVLTRSTDVFIPLRQRVAIARKAKADLFISIHADSAPGAPARGLSLYSLSETGSDKEADKLAAAENKADIIDGVDLSGASQDVTDILINLAQRATMDKSAMLARNVVRGIVSKSLLTLPTPYRTAGFAVLKAADTPSILIEIGFLSHPQEEQLLQTNRHQKEIALGIVKGIDSFFTAATNKR